MYHLRQKVKLLHIPLLVIYVALVPLFFFAQASASEVTGTNAPGTCFFMSDKQVIKSTTLCVGHLDNLKKATDDKGNELPIYASPLDVNGIPFNTSTCYNVTTTTDNPQTLTPTSCVTGSCDDPSNLANCDLIQRYVNPAIQLLSALVGVVVVISIIIGGIQYSQSAGDPQKATMARNRIRNAIIALVAYIFLYAMLNFLIPGGLV